MVRMGTTTLVECEGCKKLTIVQGMPGTLPRGASNPAQVYTPNTPIRCAPCVKGDNAQPITRR